MRSSAIALFLALSGASYARDNGVGKLPVMGYDTYNAFACDYDGEIATAQAKAMNETGLVALGYNTFILDDCYTQLERNASGYLQENKTQFPGGMKECVLVIPKQPRTKAVCLGFITVADSCVCDVPLGGHRASISTA